MDKQQTQQPVAWVWQFPDGEFYETPHHTKDECERDCCGYDGVAVPCYTAPPVPRDVLMEFGEAVRDACIGAWTNAPLNGVNPTRDELTAMQSVNIAAIADRYASQVQPERESITPSQLADHLAAGGNARLDKPATQPEPVNQQTLAALNNAADALERAEFFEQATSARTAIAAGEAAQPAVTASTEAIALLRIWQTWLGASREQCDDAEKRLWDRIEAALVQPASAQPADVPEELNLLDCSNEDFRKGWNACRNEMLYAAQKGGVA